MYKPFEKYHQNRSQYGFGPVDDDAGVVVDDNEFDCSGIGV